MGGKGEGRLPLLKTEYTRLVYSTTDISWYYLYVEKYLPKYQKLTRKLRTARLEVGLTQVEAGKRLKNLRRISQKSNEVSAE